MKALVSSLYFSLAMCGKFAFLNTLTLMCYNVMCPQLQVCPEVDRSHPNCEPNSFFSSVGCLSWVFFIVTETWLTQMVIETIVVDHDCLMSEYEDQMKRRSLDWVLRISNN